MASKQEPEVVVVQPISAALKSKVPFVFWGVDVTSRFGALLSELYLHVHTSL